MTIFFIRFWGWRKWIPPFTTPSLICLRHADWSPCPPCWIKSLTRLSWVRKILKNQGVKKWKNIFVCYWFLCYRPATVFGVNLRIQIICRLPFWNIARRKPVLRIYMSATDERLGLNKWFGLGISLRFLTTLVFASAVLWSKKRWCFCWNWWQKS